VIAANRMANEGKVHKAIRDAFDSIDTDKGGALSAVELAQMFQEQGVEVRRAPHPNRTARAAADPSPRARRPARPTSRSWSASRRARTRTTTSRRWR